MKKSLFLVVMMMCLCSQILTAQDIAFTINPTSIDFGYVTVGEITLREFTITNNGTTIFNVSSFDFQGADAIDFFAFYPAIVWPINPNESKVFDVPFHPQTSGPKTADFIIYHDADNSPAIITLTGYGIVAWHLYPVTNLEYTMEDGDVILTWRSSYVSCEIKHYKIYRDETLLFDGPTMERYIDPSVPVGTYIYAVLQCSHGGGNHSEPTTVEVTISESIESENPPQNSDTDDAIIPIVSQLYANYPNPFNPSTTISFDMARAGRVSIEVFNSKGQLVKTLVNGMRGAGMHKVVWDGKDFSGNGVSSGIYFYRMVTDDVVSVKKMVMVK